MTTLSSNDIPITFLMTTCIVSEFSETVQWRMSEHFSPVSVWKPCSQAVWGSDHSGSCSQFSFSEFNVPLLSLLYSNLLLKRFPSNTSSPCLPVDCQSPLSDSRADALLPSFYPASGWYAEGGQLLRQTKQAGHGNQDRNNQQRSISVFILKKNGAGCSYSVATS